MKASAIAIPRAARDGSDGFLPDFCNIRIVFILDYGNDLYGGGNAHHFDAGRAAFARFAAAAARHYRGKGIIWEIWNEPNL